MDAHQSQAQTCPANVSRVALVTAQLNPGGGERVVVHLACTMKDMGVEPMVVCLQNEGLLASDLKDHGVAIEAVRSLKGYDVGAIFRLARTLRSFRPAVINVHDRSSLPYVALANLLSGRRRIVYTAHGLLFNADKEPNRRYRIAMRAVSGMTAVSDEVAGRHCDVLRWRRPVDVIANGVPDPPIQGCGSDVRAELKIGEQAMVYLAVGNVREEKGFEDLVEAAVILRDAAPEREFVVLVVGGLSETPYCKAVLSRREELGVTDAVRFLGFRDDVQRLYEASDAFVLSSRSEGLPMVVLESMMAGLPIIATRVGGVPGVVAEGAGLLVDPRSPDKLAAAMGSLLDDKAGCSRMGSAGRQAVREAYGVERMTRAYLEVYARLASGGRC